VKGSSPATPHIVVAGTDPAVPRGGIAAVMAEYVAAARSAGFSAELLPTYSRSRWSDKWRLAGKALWRLPWLVRAVRRRGATVVAYVHVGGGWSLVREGMILLCARLAGARTAAQLHAVDVETYLAHRLSRVLFRAAIAPAHLVCVLTPYWRERLTAAGIGKRLAVVPNPLPASSEAAARGARARAERGPGILNVGIMTRLVPGKGVDTLIRAMAGLPEARLVVAGAGPARAACEGLASALGLAGRVEFRGWLAGEAKERFFSDIDVFCLPTRYDSFGLPLVEAMARGLPVVALRWGAIPDVVEDGVTGILVDGAESEALGGALRRLVDPALRARLGVAARGSVLERFAVETVGRRLRAAFAAAGFLGGAAGTTA